MARPRTRPTQPKEDDVHKMARSIIWGYARRNPWIGIDELAQEAALAALEARRSYDPEKGASEDTYANFAVRCRLYQFIRRQRVPVTAGSSNLAQKLDGLQRVGVKELYYLWADYDDRDRGIDMKRAAAAIRKLLDSMPEGDVAREVLLGEKKPREVAERRRLGVQRVRKIVREAKYIIGECEQIRELVCGE